MVSANTPSGDSSSTTKEQGSAHLMLATGRTRLVLAGEVDVSLAPDLTDAVEAAERAGHAVEIDARHVTFMDSSGVALLARLAHRTPAPLTMIKPPDVVRFLLEVTHIGDVITVVDEDPGFPEPDPTDPDDLSA